MNYELRPYQVETIAAVRNSFRAGHKSVCAVAPTGAGKTIMARHIARSHIEKGGNVLFLAHRRELIWQAARKIGVSPLRIIAGGSSTGPRNAALTVASVQTLLAKRWANDLPTATMVIYDECHHFVADDWSKLAHHYKDSIRVGFTATPERSDGSPLGDIFDDLVSVVSVRQLTDMGALVPCHVLAPAARSTHLSDDPVDAYLEHGGGRKAIVFCPTVRHAQKVAEDANERGIPAAHVDGTTPAALRKRILDQYAAGQLRLVANCMLLTEGFDDPSSEVCILARGCAHAGMYLQIVGRVLRPAPGKESALLIDLRGTVHQHGMPDDDRAFSLSGEPIRGVSALPPLTQCKCCGAVYRPVPVCPMCGARSKIPELPEVRRQRLERIFTDHTPEQRDAYYAYLMNIVRERGYKPGWAYGTYKARYGIWPQRMSAA